MQVNGKVPAPNLRGICPWEVNATKGARYQTHRIESELRAGLNAVGLVAGSVMAKGAAQVLAVFVIEFGPGSTPHVFSTGAPEWRSAPKGYVTDNSAWATSIDWTLHQVGRSVARSLGQSVGDWARRRRSRAQEGGLGFELSALTPATTFRAVPPDWQEGWSSPGFKPATEWLPPSTTPATNIPRALGMPLSTVLGEVQPVAVERVSNISWLYVALLWQRRGVVVSG